MGMNVVDLFCEVCKKNFSRIGFLDLTCSLQRVLISAHGSFVLTDNSRGKVLRHQYMVQLGDLNSLVIVQSIAHIDEFLKQFLLQTLALAVLLLPTSRKFLVQGGHLIFVLYNQVIDLNLDTVTSLLKESL